MTTTLEMNKVLDFYGAIGILLFAAAVLCFVAMGLTIAPVTGTLSVIAHMIFAIGVAGISMFWLGLMFREDSE